LNWAPEINLWHIRWRGAELGLLDVLGISGRRWNWASEVLGISDGGRSWASWSVLGISEEVELIPDVPHIVDWAQR
jgi:hypothetical protein